MSVSQTFTFGIDDRWVNTWIDLIEFRYVQRYDRQSKGVEVSYGFYSDAPLRVFWKSNRGQRSEPFCLPLFRRGEMIDKVLLLDGYRVRFGIAPTPRELFPTVIFLQINVNDDVELSRIDLCPSEFLSLEFISQILTQRPLQIPMVMTKAVLFQAAAIEPAQPFYQPSKDFVQKSRAAPAPEPKRRVLTERPNGD